MGCEGVNDQLQFFFPPVEIRRIPALDILRSQRVNLVVVQRSVERHREWLLLELSANEGGVTGLDLAYKAIQSLLFNSK